MTEKERLDKKIETLEAEHAKAVRAMMNLRQQVVETERAINNIEGAIQVCRDLIKESIEPAPVPEEAPPPQAQSLSEAAAKP